MNANVCTHRVQEAVIHTCARSYLTNHALMAYDQYCRRIFYVRFGIFGIDGVPSVPTTRDRQIRVP